MGNTTSNRIGNGANENNVERSTTVVSEQCAQCGSAQSARLSLLSLNKLNSDTSRSGSIGGSYSGSHKEHKRFGSVTIKMTTSSTPNNRNRRILDQPVVTITHKISPKGAILSGSTCRSQGNIRKAFSTAGYDLPPPAEISVADPRAHQLLVTHARGGWHAIPYPDQFSRHSGTCLILGDRNVSTSPYCIKVGDCFRLGSVGLVVAAMKRVGEDEECIDAKTLEFLKDEAVALESGSDFMAALASDEVEQIVEQVGGWAGVASARSESRDMAETEAKAEADRMKSRLCSEEGRRGPPDTCKHEGTPAESGTHNTNSPHGRCLGHSHSLDECSSPVNPANSGLTQGEKFICYMCYETHSTEDDALVAPCDCKGDTRYLHVQCLQKWYSSTVSGAHAQVIRTTGTGAPACKICGAAYRTTFRRADGSKGSLLEMDSHCAYLTLVVVTRHDTNPGLFNTKFRLKFGRNRYYDNSSNQTDEEVNRIVIGRSSSCNMILDYRTVSTAHASIHFDRSDRKFYLSDKRSSNGTLVYLQDPVFLPYNTPVKLRMGRTTLSLQWKKNWVNMARGYLGSSLAPIDLSCIPTHTDVVDVLCRFTKTPQQELEDELISDNATENLEYRSNRSYSLPSVDNIDLNHTGGSLYEVSGDEDGEGETGETSTQGIRDNGITNTSSSVGSDRGVEHAAQPARPMHPLCLKDLHRDTSRSGSGSGRESGRESERESGRERWTRGNNSSSDSGSGSGGCQGSSPIKGEALAAALLTGGLGEGRQGEEGEEVRKEQLSCHSPLPCGTIWVNTDLGDEVATVSAHLSAVFPSSMLPGRHSGSQPSSNCNYGEGCWGEIGRDSLEDTSMTSPHTPLNASPRLDDLAGLKDSSSSDIASSSEGRGQGHFSRGSPEGERRSPPASPTHAQSPLHDERGGRSTVNASDVGSEGVVGTAETEEAASPCKGRSRGGESFYKVPPAEAFSRPSSRPSTPSTP